MKRKNDLQELIRHDEALSKGEDVTLSLQRDNPSTQAVVAHFLRAFKGRQDLAGITIPSNDQNSDLADQMEKIRNAIYRGDSEMAETILLPILSDESILEEVLGECLLELSRVRLLQNRVDAALAAIDRALKLATLGDLSRMTCLQIRGDIQLRLGNPREAVEDLMRAIDLSKKFKAASATFSAHAFLVKAYVVQGELESAHHALGSLKLQLESAECSNSDELWLDRLLTVIRTEAHFLKAVHEKDRNLLPWQFALAEAHTISLHLGDQATLQRCINEAGPDVHFESLTCEGRKVVNSLNGWCYLPFRKVALIQYPRSILRLDTKPVIQKILYALIFSAQGLDQDVLFKQVWDRELASESDLAKLLAALSKVRKFLPPGAVQVTDGRVKLV
jgi:tetratricopeptide (TPR) repeat protein